MSENPSLNALQAESLTTIDAEHCPTCNEARFVMLRGNRVACPTCCSTVRLGEVHARTQRRLQTRGPTIVMVVAIAIGILALWANGLLALR